MSDLHITFGPNEDLLKELLANCIILGEKNNLIDRSHIDKVGNSIDEFPKVYKDIVKAMEKELGESMPNFFGGSYYALMIMSFSCGMGKQAYFNAGKTEIVDESIVSKFTEELGIMGIATYVFNNVGIKDKEYADKILNYIRNCFDHCTEKYPQDSSMLLTYDYYRCLAKIPYILGILFAIKNNIKFKQHQTLMDRIKNMF